MLTLKIKISENVYDKFINLLSKFNKEDIEIIGENQEYLRNKKYLTEEYEDIINGKASFLEINEAEERIEKIIRKHEDKV